MDYRRQMQDIVDKALNDDCAYRAMADKEAAVWAERLSLAASGPAAARVQEDQAAGFALGVNRHTLNFFKWLKDRELKFETVLSLGCGAGRLEREWIRRGIIKRCHGMDISEGALETARSLAKAEKLDITYQQSDLNFVKLPHNSYDLVIAQTSLHHCVRLEHIADEIEQCLKATGLLWLHDYIGESQLQYDQDKIDLVNRILAALPDKYKKSSINQTFVRNLYRRTLPLESPFESIRSEEISRVFLERFDVIEMRETNSLVGDVVQSGTRTAYLESEDGRALFELIMIIDEICVAYRVLRPTSGQYIFTRKSHRVDAPTSASADLSRDGGI